MKKTLLITGILALSTYANSQTITSSNIVNVGDTLINATDNSPSVSIGTTGTGNTWNFSGLLTNSSDTTIFENPATVAGGSAASTFPLATHASLRDTNYIFLQKKSASLELVGLSNGTEHVKHANSETIITFPSSYATTFTDDSRIETVVSGTAAGYPTVDSVRAISATDVSSDFNASGNLTTPLGVFPCIRQNLTRITNDTVYAKIFGSWNPSPILTQTDTSYSHQYWSDNANAKFPLVSYDVDASGALTGAIVWMKVYSPASATSGINEIKNETISIYPNPVNNTLTLDVKEDIKGITITDISGKTVFNSQNMNQKTLNVDFLNKGIYILTVTTDSYLGTTKFIKE